jgi:putative hydrolase of the HAD superfamily
MSIFDLIAFDADDTLWQTELLYVNAQAKFVQLLAHYHEPEWINRSLDAAESRNIAHFGYGIKSFALSMIETAVYLTEGRITGQDIQVIIDLAREMLNADIELLEHAADAVAQLSKTYPLMVITKGDLLDQENKIARSGLGKYFERVEVVSDKTRESYARLLKEHSIPAERFLMVGNSLRSDILPVIALGGRAVYIPHEYTWAHEQGEAPADGQPGFYQLQHLGLLPALLERLEARDI